MAQQSGREVLLAAVSEKEWNRVPSEVAKKIECFIGEKFDELINARALVETKSYNSVHALSELQTEFDHISKENDLIKKKEEGFNLTIKELEHQLSISVADVSKFQITCNELEHEVNELRTKTNVLSNDRDELQRMLDRRISEIERMQSDMNLLNQQLSDAVTEKCEALEKINEVESMKLSIEYKEKRLEQERSLMQSQIQSLSEDLDAKTEELLNLRRDKTSRCVQLEIQLSEKSAELVAANESIKKLNEANANLLKKNDEILQKLQLEKENYAASLEAFEHELEAQKKIAELYQGLNEDQQKHEQELEKAVVELQQKLDETLEKYGDLETKFKEDKLSNDELIQKKTDCIELLKKELETSKEIVRNFKNDSFARDIEEISPGASSASRLLKTGMTMTELYTQYVQVSENLATEKVEAGRLQSYIQSIVSELEEKGPLVAKQREQYERARETIKQLTKQIENLIAENQHLRDLQIDMKRSEATATRESSRLKKENNDLSRQVCHLLREVEHSRVGSSSTTTDQYLSDSTCSADIITKRLVTFSDIHELQSTNLRLLALVRELSSKQEEAEAMGPEMIASLKMKLDSMSESHAELLEQQEKNNSMVKMLIEQRDNYKTLYHQFSKGLHDEITMDQDKNQTSPNNQEENEVQDIKVQELEASIAKLKKELAESQEELETYRKEKTANEKILIEQNEKMRSEVQELMRQNVKLCTKCETTAEMLKVHKSNIEVYKTQIERLEERNRIYNETIVKHETSQSYLNDQILEAQTRLSKSEVMANNLRNENALLKENENRLVRERDSLQREHKSNSIMQKNIELIKATLVRNDAESKIRLEETLKEAHRECAALRRRLQEEQDRFRELTDHLEKQTKNAVERMQTEKDIADKLRSDLTKAREDLTEKSVQLEELSKKLKNSLLGDLEQTVEGSIELKKYRELDNMLTNAQEEIESLKQKLKITKDAVDQHCNVAHAAEKQLIDLNEAHKKQIAENEKKITEQAAQIADLEEKCSELQGELSVQNDGQVSTTSTLHAKLSKLEIQYKVTQTELEESKEQLKDARQEISRLSENLEVAENNYSREMSLHSNDLQALRTVKEDLSKVITEINQLKQERDSARDSLEASKSSWETQEGMYKKDKSDLEIRLKDLDKQNMLLLDQLQELNSQFSVIQMQLSEPQLNKSSGDVSMNRSFTEDEVKSSEQLLKIIKYLRQEKDVAVSKCEILDAEHARMKAQQDILQQQYTEAKAAFEEERQKSEISFVTTANHAEVLRKVETLNAITDSNRSLRIERDTLLAELNELKARSNDLENQLAPIQEKNTELTKKAEGMQSENITLRSEVTRWRQRANILIERSNRTSPEDWKKLQGERESLAKQLTIERANTTKLNDDINNLTADKKKLEDQIKQLRTQQDMQRDEIEKLAKEISTFKTQVSNLNTQLSESVANGIRISEENRTLTEDLASKDMSIVDLKNNLTQIRKIAKKYKIQWEEQTKELDALKQQFAAKESEDVPEDKKAEFIQQGRSELEERINQLEQTHNEQMASLNQQITNTAEENEKNKQEIENLKESLQTSLEKEERFKVLFKNAKDRIMNLTEQNNTLKSKITEDSNNKEFDSSMASGSSDIEKRLQKEKEEILIEKQQEKDRYLQEIETLTGRINQLQRQIGLQQATKPSTSSEKEKSSSETPTANIKPMASHSSNQTQSVSIQPWRSSTGEPPLASIRPMSMQNTRTAAVLPTSQSPSTAMVPPQQQVHTTGSSVMESMSSSPTSSHTDYVPATSSASSAMLGPRQVAVPPTQSNQVNEDDESNRQVQAAQQQQAVALVLPRIETPAPAQEQGTSSTSSSNTVTTTQAAHKRPREADTESQHDDQSKIQQQIKKTRTLQGTVSGTEGSVSESGLEVEYQVPTSSQRDHEEDTVIVVESDDEGPDEGEGDDYNMPYEDPDTQDPDQDDEAGNEVEVIDDSSEVPNQSEREGESDIMQGDAEEDECEAAEEGEDEEEEEVMQPEATSSGTNVSTSVAVTLPSFSRTRQVAPLSRQQQSHLLLPHGIEESGDDGIVPSTPTLFVARRCDGYGEAVSSPHVPTSGRFTFNESTAAINQGSNDVLPEQTLEMANADDNSTGRSVPSTPIQTSPHEAGPSNDEQLNQQGEVDIPSITVSGAEVEMDTAEGSMGPPSAAGTSTEASVEMQESDDGVSSEGEKAPTNEDGGEEEGREAEASPSPNTRSRNIRGMSGNIPRRTVRQTHVRGISRSGPTPIIWADQQRNQSPRQDHRNNRGNMGQNFATRGVARRRNRPQRPFGRF